MRKYTYVDFYSGAILVWLCRKVMHTEERTNGGIL